MTQSIVSVVIPFFRGKEWLREALESVVNQTYKSIEIIIVNDGSHEDISSIVNKYEDKIKYYSQKNKGAAAARNIAIDYCSGDYVAFLDSDDIWLPNKLEVQIKFMKENNSLWSHSNYIKFDSRNNKEVYDISKFKGNVFPLTIVSNHIATPTVMIKREILLKNPRLRFEESMKYGEDTILWLLLSMEYELLAINKNLVKVRLHGSNSASMATSQIKARSDIWKWLNRNKPFDVNRELPIVSRLAYMYCAFFSNKLFNTTKGTFVVKNEVIAKSIYAVPWLMFKLDKYIMIQKRRRLFE